MTISIIPRGCNIAIMEIEMDQDLTLGLPAARQLLLTLHRTRTCRNLRVRYPLINNQWIDFNQTPEYFMDLESQVAMQAAKKKSDAHNAELRQILVAPNPDKLPDDGMLQYVVVASVYDFKTLPDRSVALFDPAAFDVLKLAVENASLFGLSLQCLVGLPSSDYSVDFEGIVWPIEKIAYAPFISEMSLMLDVRLQEELASETTYDAERRQYVRDNGSVKRHDAFVMTDDDAGLDDA